MGRLLTLLRPKGGFTQRGLVGLYLFNEGSGQVLVDHSGNGKHGQLGNATGSDTNDPTWTSEGLEFDGVDDRVAFGGNPWGTIRGVDVAFYVQNDVSAASSGGALIDIGNGLEALVLGAVTGTLTNEIISVMGQDTSRVAWTHASDTIPAGWHILQIDFDGSAWDIRLDGVSKTVTTVGTPVAWSSAGQAGFGAQANLGQPLIGAEALVSLYSTIRTDAEIDQNHRAAKNALGARGITI